MNKDDLWDGKQYQSNSSPQEVSATGIIHSIEFKGSEWALDIGCGDGKITAKISHLIPHGKVIGIDPSESMITEAQKHAETVDNLFFFRMGAEDFSFTERFDYIFSFHTLHWVKDKARVFRNVTGHLKEEGKFVLITSGRGNPVIADVFASDKWQSRLKQYGPRFHSTDEDMMRVMLQESGLFVEEIKAEYWSEFYSSKDALINWLMTWVPYATGFDSDNAMVFSDEIAENIRLESVGSGVRDKIEFKTEMLSIKASKQNK
jgi:trans-aconitate 2-methyltransferase